MILDFVFAQFGVTMASQSASSSELPAQPFVDQENIVPRQENIAEDAMSVNTSVSQPSVEMPRQIAHVPLQVNHVIERREQWLAMNNLPMNSIANLPDIVLDRLYKRIDCAKCLFSRNRCFPKSFFSNMSFFQYVFFPKSFS